MDADAITRFAAVLRSMGRPDALTSTECEVVYMHTVEGCSSREIAERRVISLKTVEAHKHNAALKLGDGFGHDWRRVARELLRRYWEQVGYERARAEAAG